MKNLIAVPFDEYHLSNSDNGVKYEIMDSDGVVYVRCVVTTKKYSDHDLDIKELAEAPSNVRVEVREHLNRLIGRDKWKVVTRIPFNGVGLLTSLVKRTVHSNAVELQYNPEDNVVRQFQIE